MMTETAKVKHKISTRHNSALTLEKATVSVIKQTAIAVLESEDVDTCCVVNILITDDKGIREYNREYRNINKTTDVLSFPMQTFINAGWDGLSDPEIDKDTGELPLGDIIISAESVKKQAIEYGNTIEYETAYLTAHSTLHLLGYDHENEITEKAMHNKGKSVLLKMGMKQND